LLPRQAFHSPVVDDQDPAAAKLCQKTIVATVSMNLLQLFLKPFQAKVADTQALLAVVMANSTAEIRLTAASCPREDQVLVMSEPVPFQQASDPGFIQATLCPVVELLRMGV